MSRAERRRAAREKPRPTCLLCGKQKPQATGYSDWRSAITEGRMYHCCPDHFPADGERSGAFRDAYVRFISEVQKAHSEWKDRYRVATIEGSGLSPLVPGIYRNAEGTLFIDVPALLRECGIPDTPENRRVYSDMVESMVGQMYGTEGVERYDKGVRLEKNEG